MATEFGVGAKVWLMTFQMDPHFLYALRFLILLWHFVAVSRVFFVINNTRVCVCVCVDIYLYIQIYTSIYILLMEEILHQLKSLKSQELQ